MRLVIEHKGLNFNGFISSRRNKSKRICQYKSEIKDFITQVFPLDNIHNCIEYRQGNWEIFGYSIGMHTS